MRAVVCIVLVATLASFAACSRDGGADMDPRVAALFAEAGKRPDDQELWLQLTRICLDLWEDTSDPSFSTLADSAVTHCLGIDTTSVAVWEQYARLRIGQLRFDEAIAALNHTLERYKTGAEVWGLLGDAYLAVGDYRHADSSYYVMYELDNGFDSLRRVAHVTATLRSFTDAVGYIDRAITNAPVWHVQDGDLAAALVQRGEMFLAHGSLDPALSDADAALELAPESVSALSLRARLLSIGDHREEATRLYERITTLSSYPRYLVDFAAHLRASGDDSRADELMSTAAKRYAELARRYPRITQRDRVAFMLTTGSDTADALRMMQEDTRRRKDIDGYSLLALAYYHNGRMDAAWSSISFATRRGGQHPRLLYRAALIARAAGKMDKYETFLLRARDANPIVERVYGPL